MVFYYTGISKLKSLQSEWCRAYQNVIISVVSHKVMNTSVSITVVCLFARTGCTSMMKDFNRALGYDYTQ